jgi:hypothetical protein
MCFSYKSTKIKNTSLFHGIRYYEIAIIKFLGNSIIKRLEKTRFSSIEQIRERLRPDTGTGLGEWLDISGLIAPRSEIERLILGIESRDICKIADINTLYRTSPGTNIKTRTWHIQRSGNFSISTPKRLQ